jgi:DNA-binding LytR/AlgR family response regulator
MKILIIEDEQLAVKHLMKLIQKQLPESEFLGSLDTVSGAIQWLQSHPEPDLIFLDIQLADGISFEIFEKVKVHAPIIFCTAYDQYAIRAFKLNSIDYLLKPIETDALTQALRKFKSGIRQPALSLDQIKHLLEPAKKTYKNRFLVKWGERIQPIDVEDIHFFFSEDKVTILQTREGKKFVIDYTLEEVEDMVDPTVFFRLNRRYVSAIHAIEAIHTYSNSRLKIQLRNSDDANILVSRERTLNFKNWLGQ